MDRILIPGLRELGIHGVLPEERVRPQPFEVNIELHVDLAKAGASDDLADTVDYSTVCDAVSKVVSSESYQLLERLAQRIGEVCRTGPACCRSRGRGTQARDPRRRAGRSRRRANPTVSAASARAYLALGSNLGDRARHLQTAIDSLASVPRLTVVAASSVYETDLVGGPDQVASTRLPSPSTS